MNTPYTYFCFGHRIQSDFKFQEMSLENPETTTSTAAMITIARAPDLFREPTTAPVLFTEFTDEEQFFDFPSVIQARIVDHNRIEIAPYSNFKTQMLGLPILGPVVATLLHYRNFLVIHGSSIVINDKLHVFIGDRGAGKSTTAACLLSRHYQLFSDDLLVVDYANPQHPVALAGYPATKIKPDTFEQFALKSGHVLDNGGYHYPKMRFRIHQDSPPVNMPVHRIYCLKRTQTETGKSRPQTPSNAMKTIMRNSYMLKYGNAAFSKKRAGLHFQQCANLTRTTTVATLDVPNDLKALHKIEAILLENI